MTPSYLETVAHNLDKLSSNREGASILRVIEENGRELYSHGFVKALNDWLSIVPEKHINSSPECLLRYGQVLLDLGKIDKALERFDKAREYYKYRFAPIGVTKAKMWKAVAYRMAGDAKKAFKIADECLWHLKALDADDGTMAWAYRCRGKASWAKGNLESALKDSQESLDLFTKEADVFYIGMCHQDIGVILRVLGKASKAKFHYQKATAIWNDLGNKMHLARVLNSQAVSLFSQGDYEGSLARFAEALDISLSEESVRTTAFIYAGLGDVYLAKEEYNFAKPAFIEADRLAKKHSIHSIEVYASVRIGECYFAEENLNQAFKAAQYAVDMATELQLESEIGMSKLLLGKLYLAYNKLEIAQMFLSQAVEVFSDKQIINEVVARLWLGHCLFLNFKPQDSLKEVEEAINKIIGISDAPELKHALNKIGAYLFYFYKNNLPNLELLINLIDECDNLVFLFTFGQTFLMTNKNGQIEYFGLKGRNSTRASELLTFMILQEQPMPWRQIAAAIWPDLDDHKAKDLFKQTIRRVRDFGGEDIILMDQNKNTYKVNDNKLWADFVAFDRLITRDGTNVDDKVEAIYLYDGSFLPDSEKEWLPLRQAKYEILFAQTVKEAAQELLAQGREKQALTILKKAVDINYFAEDFHKLICETYQKLEMFNYIEVHRAEMYRVYDNEGLPTDGLAEFFSRLALRNIEQK